MTDRASGVWRNLYQSLRKILTGPEALKQLHNHSGIEMRDIEKIVPYGTWDAIKMNNGDIYLVKFIIRKI